ncbi:MAG: PQQ-like beta-propeller repeat protein [Planctomycetaceae bacterium]|nr:PQQ-like beta-propeller repeat protein [Planctomycetaceae bacterium]
MPSRELNCVKFLVLTLVLAGTSLHAADWAQWHGANRDSKSTETGLKFPTGDQAPKLLYMTEGFGKGFAGVSIVKGKLYTVGNQGNGQAVVAANAETGKVLWKTLITELDPKHSHPGSRCTPTFNQGKLYVVASSGKIVCLDAQSGSIVWEKDFVTEWKGKMMSGWGYSESPLVDGDNVLCTPGGPDAMIVCLNKNTGKEVWRSDVPALAEGEEGKNGAGYSSLVISHGAGVKQYVQLIGTGAIGVRASDGKYLWGYNQVANKVANITTPVIDGDYVFSTSSYGGGGAVLLKLKKSGDGVAAEEVYWLEKRTFNNHHGGVVLVDGYIYGGHNQNQGFPTCINAKTGEIVRGGNGLRGEGKGSAAVLYADGKLIFRYEDGVVAIIEATPKEYKVLGRFTPEFQQGKSWAHPVISNGKLYLREQDKMMCYDLKS